MTYTIDTQHSSAQFKVRHMMIANVKGEFDKLSGTVEFDPANAGLSSVEAKIDVNSISTRETDRDNHLKSPDFFDVAKFPEITFKSTKVSPAGSGLKVTGDLTIHGVTKEVTLDVDEISAEVKDGWGFLRRGTSATTRVDRRDFGLVFNIPLDAGGFVVGDHIDITIDIEMTRKAE
ncbi:MAG TPA: YceI family protein [Bryobacteraceae bacterium]|jgi:polyisoprenoid-binding protein YceI